MSRKAPVPPKVSPPDWERMFKVLRFFREAHDHCDVPANSAPDSLGHWLAEQRKAHRAGRLRREHFQRLEALGVVFDDLSAARLAQWMDRERRWNERFAQLVAFKKHCGHCDVPCHWRKDRLFGQWVSSQRDLRKKGRLSQERINRLDELGFRWLARRHRDAPPQSFQPGVSATDQLWDSMFEALLQYKKEQGHCNVRPEDGLKGRLYKWVTKQRMDARKHLLREDRRRRLEEVGFLWRGHNPQWDNWDKRFAQLVAFQKRCGHCDVPCHWRKDRFFGQWVSSQRDLRKKGRLSQERINRLDELGFRWLARCHRDALPQSFQPGVSATDQLWDSMFEALLHYKKEHGQCNVRPEDGLKGRLYKWVTRQRTDARKDRLREDRRRRLDEVGFLWRGHNPQWNNWDKRYAQLVAFKKRFGHCDVPCHWRKDRFFGQWVSSQRNLRKKGRLSQERIDRLDQIGFRWLARFRLDAPPPSFLARVKVLDRLWESQFAKLVRFRKKHGHCRIPRTDSAWASLSGWVDKQRLHWRAGRLPEDRRRRLEELGFLSQARRQRLQPQRGLPRPQPGSRRPHRAPRTRHRSRPPARLPGTGDAGDGGLHPAT